MSTIIKCDSNDYVTLSEIWERSVRATHTFLNEKDILEIRDHLIPNYFPNVEIHAVKDMDSLVGFIGLSEQNIEMLFIDDHLRGKGYGSKLIDFALKKGGRYVDVNEQNPDALDFYLRKGFRIVDRDETDESGRPFPILHLSL